MVYGQIIKRINRFTVEVKLEGKKELAFLPNSGRLKELLQKGTSALLERKRKGLPYKLLAVKERAWVSVDAHFVNDFFEEGIRRHLFTYLSTYKIKEREVKIGNKRLDFLLTNGKKEMLVEVKSCTLAVGETAMFPDAPTQRGIEHLEILMEQRNSKRETAVIFVIQREDARYFAPNSKTHFEFALTLYKALKKGVKAYYIRTRFLPELRRLTFLEMKELRPFEMAFMEYLSLYREEFPVFDEDLKPTQEFLDFLKKRRLNLNETDWKELLSKLKGGKENAIQSKGN